MNAVEKMAFANTVAAYLDGTTIDWRDELKSRGHEDLAADPEFARSFVERCWKCPECGQWVANNGQWVDGIPPCPDCDDDGDDWE